VDEIKRHSFYLKPGEKKRVRKRWLASAFARRHAKNKISGFPGPPLPQ
jgi:hypothetical protein